MKEYSRIIEEVNIGTDYCKFWFKDEKLITKDVYKLRRGQSNHL